MTSKEVPTVKIRLQEQEQIIELPADLPRDQPLQLQLSFALPMPPRRPSNCPDMTPLPDHYFLDFGHYQLTLSPQLLQSLSWPLKLVVRLPKQPGDDFIS